MRVTLSQTVYRRLLIYSPSTGFLAAPDSTPSGALYRNGTVDGAVTVTVTSISTGKYKVSFTVPSGYSVDDVLELEVTWAISGSNAAFVWAMQVDATVNSRSTYAGGDTSGTTTLLSRLTSTRAGLLDNIDATVSSRMATFTLPTNFSSLAISGAGAVTAGTVSDKTGYSLSQAFPTNFSAMVLDVSGRVQVQPGTGTGQINLSSGGVAVASMGNGVITAASIAADAITAAKIATDAIDADALAADAIAEVKTALEAAGSSLATLLTRLGTPTSGSVASNTEDAKAAAQAAASLAGQLG